VVPRKPHQVNPSGISRKNCGCPSCYQDQTLVGCEHPGRCIDATRLLVDCLLPKWNPSMPNVDLTDELALTNNEHELNNRTIETDEVMIFNLNFT
ncbi:hypothetical protein DFH08DRAFT_623276, partial [Mycena albidolilacea]